MITRFIRLINTITTFIDDMKNISFSQWDIENEHYSESIQTQSARQIR